MISTSLKKTRMTKGNKVANISTIDRDSSAAANYGTRYAETIVFVDGKIEEQAESCEGDTYAHDRLVQKYFDDGWKFEQSAEHFR